MNPFKGSGTFVGIDFLARSLATLGATVEFITPDIKFPNYTLQRFFFNQTLRFQSRVNVDVVVGFDLDGYVLAGQDGAPHVAAIKGVIADEMRFESGATHATMRLQARWEKLHAQHADLVITT